MSGDLIDVFHSRPDPKEGSRAEGKAAAFGNQRTACVSKAVRPRSRRKNMSSRRVSCIVDFASLNMKMHKAHMVNPSVTAVSLMTCRNTLGPPRAFEALLRRAAMCGLFLF